MAHRRSTRQPFAAVLVLLLALRLVLTVADLACRLLAYVFLRLCWLLERCIRRLTLEPAARPTPVPAIQARRVVQDSGCIPVPPTRDDEHEVERFARVLAGNKRPDPETVTLARQLLSTRVKIES